MYQKDSQVNCICEKKKLNYSSLVELNVYSTE